MTANIALFSDGCVNRNLHNIKIYPWYFLLLPSANSPFSKKQNKKNNYIFYPALYCIT